MPIKCAGAPQKILYLWTDQWRKQNLPIDVEFFKTVAVMFGVPKYSKTLTEVAASYNIKTTFKTPLIKVKGNEATFQNLDTKEIIVKKFDFLHIVPSMGAHSYIADSGLGDANGFLDCNKDTMRHNKYPNIWGIGDCTSTPNAKTAAAAFAQT
jgi:NADPH-dependent 2,4-dienoyl-CoA reductase/sulfur reductase-like enzyme